MIRQSIIKMNNELENEILTLIKHQSRIIINIIKQGMYFFTLNINKILIRIEPIEIL